SIALMELWLYGPRMRGAAVRGLSQPGRTSESAPTASCPSRVQREQQTLAVGAVDMRERGLAATEPGSHGNMERRQPRPALERVRGDLPVLDATLRRDEGAPGERPRAKDDERPIDA